MFPHISVRGAMRMAIRFGASAGSASATCERTLPTELRRSDIAVGRPRSRPHVPLVGGGQITRGLQVLGDQRGVLVVLVRSRRRRADAVARDRI